MMNKKEICKYFKISNTTIMKWIEQGVPCYHFGNTYRFDPEEVKEWLREEK